GPARTSRSPAAAPRPSPTPRASSSSTRSRWGSTFDARSSQEALLVIIACPECTNPFEIADGHIAPLVQIECPTCNFRMILDFEAANDASLREEGMGMAQGFRDAASYRQAVGAGQIGYSPSTSPAQP